MLPRRAFHVTSRLLHDHTADKIAGVVSRLPHVAAMIVPFGVVVAIEEMQGSEAAGKSRLGAATSGPNGAPQRPARRTKKMLLDAECQIDQDQSAHRGELETGNPIPAGDVRWRNRAILEGRIRSVYVGPVSGSPALEAELYDETGGITLVFLGRRTIPGIEPGAKMRVEGMVGETEGYLAMFNPSYRLLPRENGDEEP